MEKIDRSRNVVYCLYLRLTFGICVSLYCAEVSLLSGCVCAQGFRAEWCQSKSVSVVPASSASLKIDLSRHRERGNTPLTPSFCLSLKNTKSPKQPQHPTPITITFSPQTSALQPELDTVSHTHAGCGLMGWGTAGTEGNHNT